MENVEDPCVFFAKIGDLENLKKCIDQGYNLTPIVFIQAAKGQHLEVCKYLQRIRPNRIGLNYVGLFACKYGNFEMLNWVLDRGIQINEMWAINTTTSNKLEMLKFLQSKGMKFTERMIRVAAYNGSVDTLLYLLDSGCEMPKTQIILSRKKPNYIPILKILHDRNIPGIYEKTCKLGKCVVCKVEKIWNEWEMETYEYTSYIQQLPREILDDLSELIYV